MATADTRSRGQNGEGGDPNALDVVGLVDELLKRATDSGASDVHFEPTAKDMAVKFRLDGVLGIVERIPKAFSDNVISRLKVLGGLLTYRSDIPQEGRIQVPHDRGGRVLDQRLAVFPTIHGQRAVVRLFYEEHALNELDGLGFSQGILSALKRIAGTNQGLLLLTGPAGSGKSTTLAAMLRHVLQRFPGKSIVALEDPVERHIEGVTQVQIPPHGQMSFPVALRSLLRQDPEVLMIGEVRDSETARIAIEAALTGHLLMSTMHSGTPAGALLRLLEMGIEPYEVTSSVSAVLNQRLIRKLCETCKRRTEASRFVAVGCDKCFHTGFRGRALIAEMVCLDGELRRGILAKADLGELEHILSSRGHMTMVQDGMRLIRQAVTTPEELQKVCGGEPEAGEGL